MTLPHNTNIDNTPFQVSDDDFQIFHPDGFFLHSPEERKLKAEIANKQFYLAVGADVMRVITCNKRLIREVDSVFVGPNAATNEIEFKKRWIAIAAAIERPYLSLFQVDPCIIYNAENKIRKKDHGDHEDQWSVEYMDPWHNDLSVARLETSHNCGFNCPKSENDNFYKTMTSCGPCRFRYLSKLEVQLRGNSTLSFR
jgi:hypothetical protein